MSQDTFQLKLKPGIAGTVALAAAAVGLLGCVVSFFQDRKLFMASYLTAFSFFLAITLGSFFFMFVQYLARSSWSVTVRRISETIASNPCWPSPAISWSGGMPRCGPPTTSSTRRKPG